MLHRIRYAMHTGSINKMTGTVEADETYIGGKARNMHADTRYHLNHGAGGRRRAPFFGKAIVLGLLERETGKVHVETIPATHRGEIQHRIRKHVAPGAELHTDSLKSYNGMDEYAHKVIDHAEKYVDGNVHTNKMENFWSLLKRSIGGTYVSVEPFHLFRYLDEQSFRYNERKLTDAERFQKILGCVSGKRLTYARVKG
jgi:transposase-like protein